MWLNPTISTTPEQKGIMSKCMYEQDQQRIQESDSTAPSILTTLCMKLVMMSDVLFLFMTIESRYCFKLLSLCTRTSSILASRACFLSSSIFPYKYHNQTSPMADSETMILVISRFELEVSFIPPLRLIIPMISNLYPLRIFTSFNYEVTAKEQQNLYDELVRHLECDSGSCNATETLRSIVKLMEEEKVKNYRICLMGNEMIDWDVVMELKRRGVVIDTANTGNKNPLLVQISYITGGIHRNVRENSMIKTFQIDFMLTSKSRQMVKIDRKENVQFSMDCCNCQEMISKSFLACSVCLAVYCDSHDKQKKCQNCGENFD